jgi:hypothetical protein
MRTLEGMMDRLRMCAALGVGVAAAALGVVAVGAYATSPYKWAVSPVVVYLNPSNADVTASAAEAAVQSALSTWSSQPNSSFRYSYGGRVNDTTTSNDGRNVHIFRNASSGGSAIATTYTWTSGGSRVDSDVIYWDADYRFFTGSSGCASGAYIEDVATHELGHTLGVQHSNVSDATMYPSYTLCSTHMRTPSADDLAGLQSLYPSTGGATNTAPTVTIAAPASSASVAQGTALTFSGSATDTQDGTLTASLVWTSNLDGQIGTGGSFSRALSAGNHTVTARVVDGGGLSTPRQVSVSVTTTNTAPTVTITAPASGTSVAQGTALTFIGSASDTQNGTLTSSLVWTSNLDGQIGTGGSFSRTLTAGTHTITAQVVDSGGLTTQRSITVYAAASASATAATLTATARTSKSGVRSTGLVWSGLNSPKADIFRNGVKIATKTNDGTASDPVSSKGTYTYKLCAQGTATCTNQASVTF